MRRHPLKKLLASALGLIVLGCVWFYFAPAPLGGSTSYVVTHGISMEPRFHTGDLAIVRSQPTYHVGEIVAYHNKMLHVVALHRIIGREGDRFIFKGDNNDFIDPEHPRASQLIGALWIHIPGGGTTLESFSSPARAGLLIALGMLLLTGSVFARTRRRRRRDKRTGIATPSAPRIGPLSPVGPAVAILAIGILCLLPFLVLALLAFTRTPTTRHAAQIPYTQSGTLSYSADTAPSSVYPDGVANTGEPLFTQLVNGVNLRFDYKFTTKAKHTFTGKGSFLLLLSATDGWHRTLALGSPTYFKGNHATITTTLDLSSLLALTRNIEATTHVDSSFTLAVVPTVLASGNVENVPLHTTFAPTIQFSLDGDEVNVEGVEGKTKLLSGGTGDAASPLTSSASGSATGAQFKSRTLALGPWHVSVSAARTLALSAIGIILAGMLAALALLRPILALLAPRRRDEAASILARYGGLIIPVAHVTQSPGISVIDVADMEALVRIAEHYDRSILHERTAGGEAFWVSDESGQFRYTIGAPAFIADQPPVPAESDQPRDAASTPAFTANQPLSGAESLQPDYAASSPEPIAQQPAAEPGTLEFPAGNVYADELQLGGVISAFETQPAPAPAAPVAPEPGWPAPEPAAHDGWAAPASETHGGWTASDLADALTQDNLSWPGEDEAVDVGRTRAGAFARIAGLH